MTPFSVGRIPLGLFCALILLVGSGFTQPAPATNSFIAPTVNSREAMSNRPAQGLLGVNRSGGPVVEFLGMYSPDGKYSAASNLTRLRDGEVRGFATRRLDDPPATRPSEVPPFLTLHPRERVIENYELPAHARKAAKGQSIFAALLDDIATLAYGREKALQAPHHVTTDSRGRIIISDPAAAAVHVLDANSAFRIAGGQQRKLWLPKGVAVDAQDNIYVADSERGLVLVYDPDGRFLRYIGKRGNESLFHAPTGIAIDRARGRLYLLDTPRNLVFVLDLAGNIVSRIGQYRGNASPVEFNAPTEIALAKDEFVVLDSAGSRVQILDLQGKPLRQFGIRNFAGQKNVPEMGLGVASDGNIYVSNLDNSTIRVYDHEGRLVNSFGSAGMNLGEFLSPTGLWVDGADRIYIADTINRRVQVFHLRGAVN